MLFSLLLFLGCLKCPNTLFKDSQISPYFSFHSSSFMPIIPLNDSAICLSISILTNFCKSLFRLLTFPDAIPPFLPISRSSSGLRSVFGIKFESFTSYPPLSRFARASFTVQDTVSPLILSIRWLLLPTLHYWRK